MCVRVLMCSSKYVYEKFYETLVVIFIKMFQLPLNNVTGQSISVQSFAAAFFYEKQAQMCYKLRLCAFL